MMPKLPLSKVKKLCLEESENHQLYRSKERKSQLGEVFTPTKLVLQMLTKLPKGTKKGAWTEGKTYCDPACGNGQFLAAIAIIKRELGHKDILNTIFGVDIMPDNVQECRERLLKIAGDTEENRETVNRNIVCADALTYDFEFGKTTPLIERDDN